jgi:outer membrane lipoprotein-sorting protein
VKSKLIALSLVALLSAYGFSQGLPIQAQGPTADSIMQQVESRFQGNDFQSQVTLTTTNAQGEKQTLTVDLAAFLYDKDHTKYKVLLKVLQPEDTKGLAFLAWERVYPQPNDQWLFLPGLGQVKKLDPENARNALFGSAFNFEDVTGRPAAADTHTLLPVDTVNGRNAWVIESIPKDPSTVEFGRRVVWVDQESLILLKEELYDHQGAKLRTGQLLKEDKIDGIWTMLQAEVKNLQTGYDSTFEFSNVQHNVGLAESLFDPANLGK